MPPRNWRLRIEDILENIADIEAFIAGIDYDAFAADRRTVKAVLHSFEIIGEAAGFVPPEVQARYPDIPWMRDEPAFTRPPASRDPGARARRSCRTCGLRAPWT